MKKNENDILVIPSPFDVSDGEIASYLDQAHSQGTENFLVHYFKSLRPKAWNKSQVTLVSIEPLYITH